MVRVRIRVKVTVTVTVTVMVRVRVRVRVVAAAKHMPYPQAMHHSLALPLALLQQPVAWLGAALLLLLLLLRRRVDATLNIITPLVLIKRLLKRLRILERALHTHKMHLRFDFLLVVKLRVPA